MTPCEWIIGRDTGISSKTIWAVMMRFAHVDVGPFGFDVPHDPSDFGRCYRLLNHFPEWKARLQDVARCFPKWVPMVREWASLVELYEQGLPSERCPKLFALMQKLEDEGRAL